MLRVQFVGVILALSGVEAIANLTGVMKLDPGSTPERPSVARESLKAITPVAIEAVCATAVLGWAMLSLPAVLEGLWAYQPRVKSRHILSKRHRGHASLHGRTICRRLCSSLIGQAFGWVVGIVFLLLLLSAANTAIVAMIGLLYLTARDGKCRRTSNVSTDTESRSIRCSSRSVFLLSC